MMTINHIVISIFQTHIGKHASLEITKPSHFAENLHPNVKPRN